MDTDRLYLPRPRKLYRSAFNSFVWAALILLVLPGGATTTTWRGIATLVAGLAFVADGLHSILGGLLGYPRVTANRTGVQIKTLLSTRAADWRALSEFETRPGLTLILWGKNITARVLDADGKPRRFKGFFMKNEFQVPLEALAAELNALRGEVIRGPRVTQASQAPHIVTQ